MQLFEWQKEAIKRINESGDKNILVSAPTSAGKTLVGYYFLGIFDGEKFRNPDEPVIYTVPIKALANDKYFELTSKGLNVSLITGDIELIDEEANILICTQEVYRNRFAGKGYKVFIDEIHYIFDNPERALNYLLSLNDKDRYIFTSATLATEERFASYLKKISGRELEVFRTDFRPVELKFRERVDYGFLRNVDDGLNYIVVFSTGGAFAIADEVAWIFDGEENPKNLERQRKIFQKAEALGIPKELVKRYIDPYFGVAVYVGKIPYSVKRLIEELAREKLINFVVGTDAIGLGVNFPIDNIFFAQTTKFDGKRIRLLTLREFLQIAGRAGRVGLSDSGNIYGIWIATYSPASYEELVYYATHPLKRRKKMEEEEILIPVLGARDLLQLGRYRYPGKAFREVIRVLREYSYPTLPEEYERMLSDENILKEFKESIEGLFSSYKFASKDNFGKKVIKSLLTIPEIVGSIDLDNINPKASLIRIPLLIHQKVLEGKFEELNPEILSSIIGMETNYPSHTVQNLLVVRKIYNALSNLEIPGLNERLDEFYKVLDEKIAEQDPILKGLLKRKGGKKLQRRKGIRKK